MDRPKKEEYVNGLTHAVGAVLSVAGAVWLGRRILGQDDVPKTIACFVYVIALFGVYFSSAMSHWEPDRARKLLFRRLDQAFIYILIVASFTTFSVAYLTGTFQTVLLGAMWLIAVAGFISKLCLAHRLQSVAIWVYLGLGWMTVLAFVPWLFGGRTESSLPVECIWLIVIGGLFYSGGTYFLFHDKNKWYYHAIWHVFVMFGSLTHFVAIVKFVCP